ncbi:hypothetical protein EDD35_5925 [Amycolatopsis thermoflava]|uniref:Uncharacterized protein n=1 Tax=Amycolatopsis thermoflava TaxID=84480 RepID=A0A3N2H3K9_9PSEU|nr:hypothetical protein EDD35_5925 [Amycolatopsis thermoflava]
MPAEPPGLGGPREAGQAVSPDAAVGNPAGRQAPGAATAQSRRAGGIRPTGCRRRSRADCPGQGRQSTILLGGLACRSAPAARSSVTHPGVGRAVQTARGRAGRGPGRPQPAAFCPVGPRVSLPPSISSAPAASLPLPAAARRPRGQPAAFHPAAPGPACRSPGHPVGPGPARRLLPPRPPRRLPPPTCRPAAAATRPLPLAAATGRPPAGGWRRSRNAVAAGVGQAPRAGSVRLSRPVSTCPASCRVTPGALTVTSYQPSVVRTRWVTAVPGRRR